MSRMSGIPEGVVVATIIGVGTQQCHPLDEVTECDSWKTFGLGVIRAVGRDEDGDMEFAPIIYPVCKKHMMAYFEDVLYANDIDWSGTQIDAPGVDDDEPEG